MASLASPDKIRLATKLHPRLLTFFKRYPPPALLRSPPPGAENTSHIYTTSSISADTSPSAEEASSPAVSTSSKNPVDNTAAYRNPFLPWRNPATGVWQNPKYSLRQQADLFKIAAKEGLASLLPFSTKAPDYKRVRREQLGLRVKGTGEGEAVKGKQWERQLKGKLDRRRKAMIDMPRMIAEWKERGHGRGWKKVCSVWSLAML